MNTSSILEGVEGLRNIRGVMDYKVCAGNWGRGEEIVVNLDVTSRPVWKVFASDSDSAIQRDRDSIW